MLSSLNYIEYKRCRRISSARVILRKLIIPLIPFVPLWRVRTLLWQLCGANIDSTVWIARNALLDEETPELITIEEGVRISYGTMLITHSDLDKEVGPIHIGRQSWIGAGSIILPGVSIGPYSVVAASALVNKDVPADTRVAGVPARTISTAGVPKQWIHITDSNYDSMVGSAALGEIVEDANRVA